MLIGGIETDGKLGLHMANPEAGKLVLTWVEKEKGKTETKIVPLDLNNGDVINQLLKAGVPKYQETAIY